jgi:S-adenosylmethionine hydrolase
MINCSAEGSQFRSRDIFPKAFGKVMHGQFEELGVDITESVPDLPQNVVCYTDGYGNMKTSIDSAILESHMGRDVVLDINGRKRVAKITDGMFSVSDGQLCLAPGSAGWAYPDGTKQRFVEVILRGGNAAKEFGKPPGGIAINWSTTN